MTTTVGCIYKCEVPSSGGMDLDLSSSTLYLCTRAENEDSIVTRVSSSMFHYNIINPSKLFLFLGDKHIVQPTLIQISNMISDSPKNYIKSDMTDDRKASKHIYVPKVSQD